MRLRLVAESGDSDLPPADEALDASVRLLLRTEIFTREELTEELEKSAIVK